MFAGPVAAFALITGIMAAAVALVWNVDFWAGWPLGTAGTFAEFCERNRMIAFVRQPANTWSNLAYLFYGLLCFRLAIYDSKQPSKENLILRWPIISWVFGFTFVYLCLGSFFYHASLTRMGQHFDMGGTYALVAFPVLVNVAKTYNYYRPGKERMTIGALIAIAAIVFMLIFVFKWHLKATETLGGLIVAVIASTLWYHVASKKQYHIIFGALAVLSMAFAYFIWHQDRYKVWCDPDSLVQGHAFWHVFTGLGGFFVYLMLRSEVASGLQGRD